MPSKNLRSFFYNIDAVGYSAALRAAYMILRAEQRLSSCFTSVMIPILASSSAFSETCINWRSASLIASRSAAEVVADFVDSLHEFVLDSDVCLVTCSSVILKGNDSFGYMILAESFDDLLLPFRKVRIVVRVRNEFLDLVLVLPKASPARPTEESRMNSLLSIKSIFIYVKILKHLY